MYAKIDGELEKKYAVTDFPLNVALEPTNNCNLDCIMCGHSNLKKAHGFMSMKLYKKIIDEVAGVNPRTRIWLDCYGEPLIAGYRLYYMIDYAKKKGLENVCINSNGQLLSQEYADMLLDAGIDYISLDCDGYSKEVYEKIRKGGDRDRFFCNAEYLLEEKQRRSSKTIVEIKVIDMPENRAEIEQIISYWREHGAWTAVRRMSDWGRKKTTEYTGNEGRIACGHLFGTCAILWDGDVASCCWGGETDCVGNVNEESITDIWKRRNEGIVKIHLNHDWEKLPDMCRGCTTWKNVGENRRDEHGRPVERNYDSGSKIYE